MAEVVEVNDIHALGVHRMAWNSLFEQTPRASFFHTYDWLSAYWRHFGHELKLRAMVVYAAGKPVGIVPFCVRHERRQLGSLKTLTYPLDNWGMWYSPIGGAQSATLWMAMRRLAESGRDWDQIDLPWIDDGGSDHGRTARAMGAAGLPCRKRVDEATSVIDLEGDWEGYIASRCSKTRHEFRRTQRRVEESGNVEYVRHRPRPLREGDGDPAWDLYDECEEVARASWQAESTNGNTLCHDRYRSFLRDAHAAAARVGMVDINLLRIDGRPVAFIYNYHHRGSVFGLRMGYRSDCPQKGVGTALLLRSIESSFALGDQRLEMGAGNQEYKRRIRTRVEHNYRLSYTPVTSWRSQAARLGRWVRSQTTVGQPAIRAAK